MVSYEKVFYLNRKKKRFDEFKIYVENLDRRKIKEEVLKEVENLYKKGISQKKIHSLLKIPYSSVRTIVQRLRKKGVLK